MFMTKVEMKGNIDYGVGKTPWLWMRRSFHNSTILLNWNVLPEKVLASKWKQMLQSSADKISSVV